MAIGLSPLPRGHVHSAKVLTMIRPLLLITILTAASCATQPPAADVSSMRVDANERFDQLAEQYFEELLALNPLLATSIGDPRFDHLYVAGFSEEQRAASQAMERRYLGALHEIDPAALDEQRLLSRQILARDLEGKLATYRFPSHLQPVNQFYNFASGFAQLGSGAGIHPFRTVENYEDFLARVNGFEEAVDIAIGNMRRGIASGVVQPRVLIEKAIPQVAAHVVESSAQSIFWQPVAKMPEHFSEAERQRLTEAYRNAITNQIIPGYAKLERFLREEYLEAARSRVGLSSLPDGEAWYRQLVRNTTTTDLTPDQIHRIGLDEVARIRSEMESVRREVGFEGDLAAFFEHLQNDPRHYASTREELLGEYRRAKSRIDASTGRLFDMRPAADYEIRPVEEFRERSASSGSYMAASVDGTRPGVFYLNTYDLKSRPKYAMEALLLHEGSPGHHFQISFQRELEDLPRFRRFGGFTAYVEGWGLYAESIGRELGVYTDPYQYFGSLDAELWRAIRLVLDTGIHAKGWTREQAIEYAKANSAVGETRVVAEVERFIAIPSQALAYKIGQLKITELRRRAEQVLGPLFDVKAFHREVLEDGALPLDVLEAKIDAWIEEQIS